MGFRMGISATIPKEDEFVYCSMSYDSNFIYLLEHVPTSCIKCEHYEQKDKRDEDGYNNCYGCYSCLEGYYILPKNILLENPSVKNYEAMYELFEEEKVDVIYIILF